ncbi:MAG: DUF4012 domain-containing protein [Acidimicrobiia bacterium]|nr:DUF4012 domain-containing protein [Acidimicrobiia bacterium]
MLGVGLFVVVWLIATTATLFAARSDVSSGVDALESARDELSPSDLIEGTGLETLAEAEEAFQDARSKVRGPLVTPLRALPVVGRQIRSVDAMSGAAAGVVAAGTVAIEEAQAELDKDPTAAERVGAMRNLALTADTARAEVAAADLGPTEALVGPLADARNEFAAELADAEESLGKVTLVADALAGLFEGPTRYVLVAANNAEMRGGSGMLLSAGPLVAVDGTIEVGDLVSTADLRLPPGAVPLDPESDLAKRWGFLSPNEEWRNLATTPNFDMTGPLTARMWTAATGQQVDGVLAVDPVGLQALLAATGPVEVDGEVIDEDNVLAFLFHDQYADVSYDDPEQSARRERLGDIAGAVVDALDEGDYDTATLAETLIDAAEGRHILAWSEQPDEQAGWEAARIDGELDADSVMVSVLNRGANKLDQFLDVQSDLTIRAVDEGSEATLRITLANDTPAGEPPYIAGPHPRTNLEEGSYRGLLSVDVPGTASDVALEGTGRIAAIGSDGAAQVIAGEIEVPRGGTLEAVVTFLLPEGVDEITVESSSRVPGVSWSAEGDVWTDTTPRRVVW